MSLLDGKKAYVLEGEGSSGPRSPNRSDLPACLHLKLSADVLEQLLHQQEGGQPPKLAIAWSDEKRNDAVSPDEMETNLLAPIIF